MRWAIVVGVVRKAPAISSVLRSQTSRRVIAICVAGTQRRMAAGEDQPEPIILDVFVAAGRTLAGQGLDPVGDGAQRGVKACAAAQETDGLEPARRDEPGAAVGGHPRLGPLLGSGDKRVVQRLFGQIEIAEQADE